MRKQRHHKYIRIYLNNKPKNKPKKTYVIKNEQTKYKAVYREQTKLRQRVKRSIEPKAT